MPQTNKDSFREELNNDTFEEALQYAFTLSESVLSTDTEFDPAEEDIWLIMMNDQAEPDYAEFQFSLHPSLVFCSVEDAQEVADAFVRNWFYAETRPQGLQVDVDVKRVSFMNKPLETSHYMKVSVTLRAYKNALFEVLKNRERILFERQDAQENLNSYEGGMHHAPQHREGEFSSELRSRQKGRLSWFIKASIVIFVVALIL